MAMKDILEAVKRRMGTPETPPEFQQAPRESIRLSNPWHAVAIQPGPKRCEAVGKLAGRRFLSKQAPLLPLKDCDEAACSCRYRHHEDRRREEAVLDRNGMPLPHEARRTTD